MGIEKGKPLTPDAATRAPALRADVTLFGMKVSAAATA